MAEGQTHNTTLPDGVNMAFGQKSVSIFLHSLGDAQGYGKHGLRPKETVKFGIDKSLLPSNDAQAKTSQTLRENQTLDSQTMLSIVRAICVRFEEVMNLGGMLMQSHEHATL